MSKTPFIPSDLRERIDAKKIEMQQIREADEERQRLLAGEDLEIVRRPVVVRSRKGF